MARVLIIDDEPSVRTVLRALLEREGHTVRDEPDSRAGLALLRTSSVDLVLTDIFMPEKDGIEVIMGIKRRWPRSKVIAITGGGTPDRRNRSRLRFYWAPRACCRSRSPSKHSLTRWPKRSPTEPSAGLSARKPGPLHSGDARHRHRATIRVATPISPHAQPTPTHT